MKTKTASKCFLGVVERTFAWLDRYRRLSKDYERTIRSSEGMIYLASIHTMTKRLAPDG